MLILSRICWRMWWSREAHPCCFNLRRDWIMSSWPCIQHPSWGFRRQGILWREDLQVGLGEAFWQAWELSIRYGIFFFSPYHNLRPWFSSSIVLSHPRKRLLKVIRDATSKLDWGNELTWRISDVDIQERIRWAWGRYRGEKMQMSLGYWLV